MKTMEAAVDQSSSLMDFIKLKMGYSSNSKARDVIKLGMVAIDGKVVNIPSTLLKTGQIISFDPDREQYRKSKVTASGLPVEIMFEDNHLLVFNKPARRPLLTKGSIRGVFPEIRSFYKNQGLEEDIFHINIVPMTASGLVLVAKSLRMKKELEAAWKKAVLRYYAVVYGVPNKDEGIIEAPIHYTSMGKAYTSKDEGGKVAITKYEVLNKTKEFSLLRIDDETKLKSQINAHLAHLNLPIVGDIRDGGKKGKQQMMLHLFSMHFEHPITKESVTVKTRVPKEFLALAKGRI